MRLTLLSQGARDLALVYHGALGTGRDHQTERVDRKRNSQTVRQARFDNVGSDRVQLRLHVRVKGFGVDLPLLGPEELLKLDCRVGALRRAKKK